MNAKEQREIARDLHDKLVAYWHDVDFNWGRNAGSYYTDDAVFESVGTGVAYNGRPEIEEFYGFRQDRGARTNVHVVSNFHGVVESETRATGTWICLLYAHDGEPPQLSAPPISITRVVDIYVLDTPSGEWLCQRRTWHPLFRGGSPATTMRPEDLAARRAAK